MTLHHYLTNLTIQIRGLCQIDDNNSGTYIIKHKERIKRKELYKNLFDKKEKY